MFNFNYFSSKKEDKQNNIPIDNLDFTIDEDKLENDTYKDDILTLNNKYDTMANKLNTLENEIKLLKNEGEAKIGGDIAVCEHGAIPMERTAEMGKDKN